ncbi:uncharacterized protein [Nicotiana tomentosiformis]|uniref:uncharacterized protein n=1 Tax=Nicotiana tomentosiformis TaxID=4098 RepID=UPI00388CAE68
MEKGYQETIHTLEENLRNLHFEKDLQAQESEGEKKSLIRKNEAIRVQLQQIKKASKVPVRSWKDQKTIANLMGKVQDYDAILAKTEKALDKAKEKIVQLNNEAKSRKDRQATEFEEERAHFKRERVHWVLLEAQLQAELKEMIRYNRDCQHANFDRERAQVTLEQARLRALLESALDREGHIREIATTRQQQLQDRDQNFQYFRQNDWLRSRIQAGWSSRNDSGNDSRENQTGKEHARVLIKILNKAHVSEKTTINQLEKVANRFFEVNIISFTDDELPEEGAGHNRALHLIVKCEGHFVKQVMVDGGSSVDLCPLSTLQSMKINTNRIRPSNIHIRDFDGSSRDILGRSTSP